MSKKQEEITDLVALVFRKGFGCRQYPFLTVEKLEEWTKRHPYRDEILRVMPVKDMKPLGDKWVPAAEAAAYVRDAVFGQGKQNEN